MDKTYIKVLLTVLYSLIMLIEILNICLLQIMVTYNLDQSVQWSVNEIEDGFLFGLHKSGSCTFSLIILAHSIGIL